MTEIQCQDLEKAEETKPRAEKRPYVEKQGPSKNTLRQKKRKLAKANELGITPKQLQVKNMGEQQAKKREEKTMVHFSRIEKTEGLECQPP